MAIPAILGISYTRTCNGAIGEGLVAVYDTTSSTSPAQAEQAADATLPLAGFARESYADGEDGTFILGGTGPGTSGAALATVGLPLTADANGRLIEADTTGQNIYGWNLTTAGAADVEIEVLRAPCPGILFP